MNLYIKYINNQIVEHPMLEENLKQVFPELDFNNLPGDLKRFERLPQPAPSGPYVNVAVKYELGNDDIVRDVYYEIPYTAEEKQKKIDDMIGNQPFPSWIFDEAKCIWLPPIEYPNDGDRYTWNEETTSWVKIEKV